MTLRPRSAHRWSASARLDREPGALEVRDRRLLRLADDVGHEHRPGAGRDDERHRLAARQRRSRPPGSATITVPSGWSASLVLDVEDEAELARSACRRCPCPARHRGQLHQVRALGDEERHLRSAGAACSPAADRCRSTRPTGPCASLLRRLDEQVVVSSCLRAASRRLALQHPAPCRSRPRLGRSASPSSPPRPREPAGGSCSTTVPLGRAVGRPDDGDVEAASLEQRARLGRRPARPPRARWSGRCRSAPRRRTRREQQQRARRAQSAPAGQPALLGLGRLLGGGTSGTGAAATAAYAAVRRRAPAGRPRRRRGRAGTRRPFAKRLAGSLASARRTTASSAGVTPRVELRSGAGAARRPASAPRPPRCRPRTAPGRSAPRRGSRRSSRGRTRR